MSGAAEPAVLSRKFGRTGRIVLNRVRALNALNIGMIRAIATALEEWRNDPAVHAVVIVGGGDRAFCAGGDIRAIRDAAVSGRSDEIETFFTEEYALNGAIATYPKPFVALVDGICMGGGIGVSVHGAVRVATEAALFAMPETGIGFFPDIGASYVLPRLRGHIGMYMALTGARLPGPDAVFAGLATHYVEREEIARLPDALAKHGVAALAGINHSAPAPLAAHMDAIDHCFSADSLTDVVGRLAAMDTEWSRHTLLTLRAMSPSSVTWSFRLVRAGAGRTLPECLAAELALTRHATKHPDFAEGVRAMVIDKDRLPKWTPATLEEVDPAAIEAMFAPGG